jgi:predicted permease
MRFLHRLRYLVRSLVSARRMDAELEEELRDHVAREAASRMRHGAAEPDAHRQALIALGGSTRYAEEAREARGWHWVRDAADDSRHAVRLVRKYPGFATAMILITALGIGAATAVFSAVNGVLLRPLPFASPDQIMMLRFTMPNGRFAASGLESYAAIAQDAQVLSAAGVYGMGGATVTRDGEPQQLRVEYLTPSALALLGVKPFIGRVFGEDDVARDIPVALLSHAMWQERFAGDSSIVGRMVELNGVSHSIIGVMPAEFLGPRLLGPALWLPARVSAAGMMVAGQPKLGGSIMVRLANGVTASQAEAWLAARLRVRVADPIGADSVAGKVGLESLLSVVLLDRREPLLILFAAVGFVVILVAATVATLGVARATVREREMAIRRALGASRSRHVRQVLTETLVLMLIGGALGVLLARGGLALFVQAGVDWLPRMRDIRIDWRVLGFAALLTTAAGLAAGGLPTLAASDAGLGDVRNSTRDHAGRRRATGFRAWLVIIEVAVSVVLLIGAGLLMKGFLRVFPSSPGYAIDHRVRLQVSLGDVPGGSPDSAAAHLAFVQDVLRRMTALHGVRDAAVTSFLPLVLSSALYPFQPEGTTGKRASRPGHQRPVSANYFSLMRVPVVAGRGFTAQDDRGSVAVTIVNETAASRWWPGESPLGKHLTWGRPAQRATAEVVGVVRDVRFSATDTAHITEFYVPYAQVPYRIVNFVAYTADDPHSLIRQLKQQIWDVDPKLPIGKVETLDEIVGDSVKEQRLYVSMITVFAVIAIVLAAAGIFSVLAYSVSQRTREIAIRLALGAPQMRVTRLVLRQGAIIAGIGLATGVIAARMLTRFMQSLLLLVSPTDPAVFATTILALALVALAACAVPLRRALTVDPVRGLKVE